MTGWRPAGCTPPSPVTRLNQFELRVPGAAAVGLRGELVVEVVARGKHLLTRIGTDWTLHTHLQMDGTWRLYSRGRPWRGSPAHQIRAVLGVLGVGAVGYRLPVVGLLRRDPEHRAVGHLGPDLLGADWDLVRALANLLADPGREIGLALLDQRVLADWATSTAMSCASSAASTRGEPREASPTYRACSPEPATC